MKNIIIGILTITTAVFGGLYFAQSHKTALALASAEVSRREAADLQSKLDTQEKETARARDQLEEARVETKARNQETAQLKANLQQTASQQAQRSLAKTAGQTNAKPSNLIGEMFKNPEMKGMIKDAQKAALSGMVDKNYGKLFSDMGLTPEQSAALKEMILNKQLEAANMGVSMLSEDSATNRADMAKQIKAANDTSDAKIKEFLGDDNYTKFQDYEKSMGERTMVSDLKDRLGAGINAITDTQEQQLLQALVQERQNFKFTTDFGDKSKFDGDLTSMFTEEKIDTYFNELDQLHQRCLTQARSILSPDQETTFEKYLDGQQKLQKAGMQMAAKMFAPPKAAGD
jgi:hypothetical protein